MPFDWLSVAIELGLRGWDWAKNRSAPFGRDDFTQAYSKNLSRLIELERSTASGKPSLSELEEGAKLTLKAIAAVVRSLHRDDHADDLKINANYMIPEVPRRKLVEHGAFCDKGRREDSFSCFLVLKQWAHAMNGLPKSLILPVEKTDGSASEGVLFGAPLAFVNNRMTVVNNTLRLRKHLKGLNVDRREEIAKYFKLHKDRMRSFICLPVELPDSFRNLRAKCVDDVVAVVCVQSSRKAVAGIATANQARIRMALLPMLNHLAYFIVKLHYQGQVQAVLPTDEPETGSEAPTEPLGV